MIRIPDQEKEWSRKRADTLADDLDILLGDLCVIWGLCGGLAGWELTHTGAAITVEDFARRYGVQSGRGRAAPKRRGIGGGLARVRVVSAAAAS